MLTRRQLVQSGAAGVAGALVPGVPAFGAIVDKPTKLILGFPPGGSTDVVSRLLINQLSGYASNFIVDNRPGAGGRIGVQAVKASPADGSVMGLSPASILVIYPHVYKNLPYDPVKDLEPVCTACSINFGLAVGPAVPESVKSFEDFVKWCRANPGKASYGSSGAGSMPHFAGVLISKAANFDFVHVAYRGAAPAVQDLVAGQIAANLAVVTNVLPYIQSGKVRVLATTGRNRSPFLTNTPTLTELGMKDLVAEEWFGIYMPAGTPRKYTEGFAGLVRKAIGLQAVADTYRKLALEPTFVQLDELGGLLKNDLDKWGKIVAATGFKME